MRYLTILATAVLAGCGTSHGFLKQIESQAYDGAAVTVSEYCKRVNQTDEFTEETFGGKLANEERIQARREIRQRGENGPKAGKGIDKALDANTAQAGGPVVRIWCEGEEVPEVVWQDFLK